MGPDEMHALDVEDVRDVDVDDARVGVRRAEDGGMEDVAPRQHVVDVPALAAQEPLVLDPLDPLAEQLGAHRRSSAIAAARSTDFTMFA